MRDFLGVPILAIAALLCVGCPPASAPGGAETLEVAGPRTARDVVLVTIDTLRWDAVGWSGAGRVQTPLLDSLAAKGVAFERAHAHAVVTLPSHASILTGLYPYEHGLRDNARFTLRPGVETLASRLRDAGWATAAFVSAFPLDRRFGLAAGFDVYDDEFGRTTAASFRFAERTGEATVERARAWWDGAAAKPRFLWVHLFTPHFPYEPAEPFASRHRDAPYWGEAEWADAQLRPLLAPLAEGGGRPALVVVTADHGESLGEHREQTHGLFAYEATLRVPLMLWAPGLLVPGRSARHARHVDLLPTICDLVGVGVGPGLSGRSLASPAEEDEATYFEALSAHLNRGWAPLTGRIESGIKAIDLPIPELYDLARDPGEIDNLAPREPDRLATLLARQPEEALAQLERGQLDASEMARLRALGYLAGSTSPAAEGSAEERDPKRLIETEYVVDAALSAWSRGDAEGAIARLRELIAQQPNMAVGYSHLAAMQADLGRLEAAIETLRTALGLGIANEDMRVRLALGLVRAGRPQEAQEVLHTDGASPDPETQSALGRIAATLGHRAEARARFERALALDPTHPAAWVDLGTLQLDAGELERARASLERGLGEDPGLAEGWNALGVVRLRIGDAPGARTAWERAVEADPRYSDALYNLALAQGKAGEYDRARGTLERYARLVEGVERERALDMLRRLPARRGG